MEMFTAVSLIIIGLTVGFLGLKLFKIMLPLAGLLVGAIVGFTGIQGIFGTGATSTTIAVLVACVFGLVLALLSYAFFDIALVLLIALGISSLFTVIGIALGLSENGFVLALLSLSGLIIGAHFALSSPLLSVNLVTLATSFAGMGFLLAGIFLLGSSITISELSSNGIIATVTERVSDSFIWALVWISGVVIMRLTQISSFLNGIFPEHLGYQERSAKS